MEGVSRRYRDVEALREISLSVAPGELVAVLGASGSGKSTLLRTIAGLEAPDAGRVLIGGADQAGVAPVERGVAMVFQSFALFPHLTVERNIAFGMRARGEPKAAIAARVRETAAALGARATCSTAGPASSPAASASASRSARALAARPRVLLLDEPLSNLDAQLRVSTRGEIRRVQEETGVTALHVTHDQGEALALGHRVAVLRDGRVEQLGTPDEIWERPANTWVARFVGTPPMNLPADDGHGRLPRRGRDVREPADDGEYTFELAERAGADRLWHLRSDGHAVIVRAPAGVEPPERGARVRVDVPPSGCAASTPNGRALP